MLRSIPTLSGGGRLGHGEELRNDRLNFLLRLGRECGDIGQFNILGRPVVFVNSPALLHELLVEKVKDVEKSAGMRLALYPLAGEGLFTSTGDLWRKQRKLMAPLFQHGQLEHYAECMVACATRGAQPWQDGAVIDLAKETTRITMGIAGKSLFDADTFDHAEELAHALTVALDWTGERMGSARQIVQVGLLSALRRLHDSAPDAARKASGALLQRAHQPLLFPNARDREYRRAVETLNHQIQHMIDQRRAGGLQQHDLMTQLLKARDDDDGTRMTDKQVRDEILTLFVAGHETTANGLAWTFHLLSTHPQAYARVKAEADALGGATPTVGDVRRLGYSVQVFKEALRLFPPLYVFGRQATRDVEIGGHLLPARTAVFVSPYALHRRADIWPDPERFDPDRFTREAEEARHKQAYLPFSSGPRVCIGNHFALMEAALVMARITQLAILEPGPGGPPQPETSASLRPRNGMPMVVRLRKQPAETAAVTA